MESENGLLTTVAWRMGGKTEYALEGSVFVAGASIQWLRDEMKLISTQPNPKRSCVRCANTAGVYVPPSPAWVRPIGTCTAAARRGLDPRRGTRASSAPRWKPSPSRMQTDVMDAMTRDSGIPALSDARGRRRKRQQL